MQKYNKSFSNRILNQSMYKFSSKSNLLLKDKIVAYNNGINWRIVPLDIFLRYPVLHDKYFENDKNIGIPITIAVCPFTLASCVFEGTYYPSEYLLHSSLVLTDIESNLLPIITGHSINPNGDSNKIKRWECKIKIFRNAISDYPDCQFINININLEKSILEDDYYYNNIIEFPNKRNFIDESNIHPKTLVHILQYKSSKTLSQKNVIIVGSDANPTIPTGFDVRKSGLLDYIKIMEFKLKEKSSFMIPILWFSYKNFYPNAKIIQL